ncbi:MAG: hypothetical protein LH616_04450, partial [Ilumatobacteraceae bacterium]|nr:hypothetical protein [Ilumatobacteraceae bacterium]
MTEVGDQAIWVRVEGRIHNPFGGDGIERRPHTLGKTGEKVSAIGLGGHHIGRPREKADGIKLVRTAIDRGINFMD